MKASRVVAGLRGALRVSPTPDAVADDAAKWLSHEAAAHSGDFHVALAGGSTPKLLYERLSAAPYRDSINWQHWHVWFGDERAVPPDDLQSNYHFARETLLSAVPIPAEHVHRMQGESDDLGAAAQAYATELRDRAPTGVGDMPRLDVVLLGLGDDGHTASLFPGDGALDAGDTSCVRARAARPPFERLTLTFPALNAAANVAFLVTGAVKQPALTGVSNGSVPAARVDPTDGTLTWFLDRAAAG